LALGNHRSRTFHSAKIIRIAVPAGWGPCRRDEGSAAGGDDQTWAGAETVTVVTGANRGIGLEVVRQVGAWQAVLAFLPLLRASRHPRIVNVSSGAGSLAGMGGPGGRPVAEGAASVLWAVDLPDDGPTGGFFRDGRPVAW
jgi:hypothetical protein